MRAVFKLNSSLKQCNAKGFPFEVAVRSNCNKKQQNLIIAQKYVIRYRSNL